MSGAASRDGLGPFEPYWTHEVPSPGRGRAWRRRVYLGAAVGAAMIGAAALTPARPPIAEFGASVVAASRPLETMDPAAAPAIGVEGLDLAGVRYESRVAPGGLRRDALSVGAFDGAAPALRLEVRRDGATRAAPSLYVAAAETAAAADAAVERLGATGNLVTLEGPVEWAELTLAGREGGCAAFRLAPHNGSGLRGVVCGAAGTTVEAAGIACLVEKLSLTKAGREAGFADLLRSAPRRAACRTPLG